jgi:Domain of unknown function (DUF2828)
LHNSQKGKVMQFANAINNQKTRTTNGMKARVSSANACVDLFYNVGASRGKNIIPAFTAAYVENSDLALRIMAWARDVRGGSGERQLFRDVLAHLENTNPEDAVRLMAMVPELGRWDDLFVFKTKPLKDKAYTMLGDALRASNGLAAKWTPRKGDVAREIREFFGMTPKQYRKSLVALTNVVETQMCAQNWDNINYNHVPSLAHARYKKAFGRHGTTYAEYVAKLAKGEAGVKINAGAVFPYDVLKGAVSNYGINKMSKTELDAIQAQWDALPNYVGDADVLPMVDSSGSMSCAAGGYSSKSGLTCLEVALSLGLYFADKNKGKFADCFLTFSNRPKLVNLKGNIIEKMNQMNTGEVANTNLNAAFDLILKTAVDNKVPQSEMPGTLLILSDMQFDGAVDGRDESALKMIKRKYQDAGYEVPRVVFWNLNAAYGNTPVKYNKSGTALVSGFAPALAQSIMANDLDDFTPEAVMLKTVMQARYDLPVKV